VTNGTTQGGFGADAGEHSSATHLSPRVDEIVSSRRTMRGVSNALDYASTKRTARILVKWNRT
jgi:hypothetical protein